MTTFPPGSRSDDELLLLEWAGDALAGISADAQTRAHTEYQDDPFGWITGKLGVAPESLRWSDNPGYDSHVWDGTPDPLVAILDALVANENVGVESGTGTQKTYTAACIVLWFLACFEDSIVVTAAPKESQLKQQLWKEVGRLWPAFQRLFPEARLLDGKIRMRAGVEARETWAATAFVCGVGADEESATKAQGFHAKDMLIVTEETPGIDQAIMAAFENTRTDEHNLHLALGNPDHRADALHQFCLKPYVRHVRISALDHPNVVTGESVVPGAVSRKRVKERRGEFGEGSRMYQSRVRGISPAEAADALIKQAWLDEAARRYSVQAFRDGELALGVDVANSENGDRAAIARGRGACLLEVRSFQCPDSVQLGVDVGAEIEADGIDPKHVGVDSVGVGAGTVGRLREMGYGIQALNAGARPRGGGSQEAKARTGRATSGGEEFANLRSQMWWLLRVDLEQGHIALPDDSELFEELTTPVWFTRNGKIFVEPKEDIRKRLGRSCDKADAVCLWNAVRPRVRYRKPDPEPRERHRDYGLERILAEHNRRNSRRGPRRPSLFGRRNGYL